MLISRKFICRGTIHFSKFTGSFFIIEILERATWPPGLGVAWQHPTEPKWVSMFPETDKTLILGTAGHIDHGKTSLVYALTGTNTDRLPEEKKRGITIDLGFAFMQQSGVKIGIVDVPGHEKFIRQMLAGASGFDLALLIVAADDGVMPQTREHLEILKIMGLRSGLIVLTKCDIANPDWLEMVEVEIGELVQGTFLADAPILRVSARQGTGIAELKSAIFELATRHQSNQTSGPFRLCVDRAFNRDGHGVIVSGTVISGKIEAGQNIQMWPGGNLLRVRSLQSHGESVQTAEQGMRLAINLAGIKLDEISRGSELAGADTLTESYWTAAAIKLLDNAPFPIKQRATCRLHAGTRELACSILTDSGTDLEPGSDAIVLLKTREPVTMSYGQPFVIRSESPQATLAGGTVIWPSARWIKRKDKDAWNLLERLHRGTGDERLEAWMTLAQQAAPDPVTSFRELGLNESQRQESVTLLNSSGRILTIPRVAQSRPVMISKLHAEALIKRLQRRLSRFHRDNPRLTGMAVNHIVGQMRDIPADLLQAVITKSVTDKKVRRVGTLLANIGFTPQLTQAEIKLREKLLGDLLTSGRTPPLLDEWVKQTGTKPAIILDVLRIMISEGLVEEIYGGLFLSHSEVQEIRNLVIDWFTEHETMTVGELRNLLGLSRKHAVPIAEWLDQQKITVRAGDVRYLYKSESLPPLAATSAVDPAQL